MEKILFCCVNEALYLKILKNAIGHWKVTLYRLHLIKQVPTVEVQVFTVRSFILSAHLGQGVGIHYLLKVSNHTINVINGILKMRIEDTVWCEHGDDKGNTSLPSPMCDSKRCQ